MQLANCPFCGSNHVTIGYSGQPAQSFHVTCTNCGATGPTTRISCTATGSYTSTEAQSGVDNAILAWGKRPDVSMAERLFDIDAYGEFVDEMWFPSKGGLTDRDFRIMELGLPGEVGEVLELLKKHVRDGVLDKANLKKELGDVVYYWTRICTAHGFTPSEVLLANVQKIEGRHQRNTLQGSGDDR